MKKPLVYIASPFTKGDQFLNLRAHIDVFNKLIDDGYCVPVAPLFASFAHMIQPRTYDDWLHWDFHMLAHCHAVYANDAIIDGEKGSFKPEYVQTISDGREREIQTANRIGIPVFWDSEELQEFCEAWQD